MVVVDGCRSGDTYVDAAMGSMATGSGFVAVVVVEQFKKRWDPTFVDDDLLVSIVVLGQRGELESRVCSILRLTHVKHSDVGPNSRQNWVVARYRRQRKVGPVIGIVDRE
ncbi:hypothetical protein SO802_018541 [Lithocarpus litseifolius]|uniref:Uncharacterized protein n=1 Tax=Lithocarpus litseifolius TaxID=425828 RepID=A0AAW2CMB0_9ROSI